MTAKQKRPRPRLPRGFVDISPRDALRRAEMVEAITKVYRLFGFEPLETPMIEYLDALGKFLPDVEAPDQGVFALHDDDESWIALRYDHTAPLARYVAQNRNELSMPFRRYSAGPVFRRDKPGPGRFRQFIQCDFDTVGTRSAAADAEAALVVGEGLKAIGLQPHQFTLKVNNRKILNGILDRIDVGTRSADGDQDPQEKKSHVLRSMDKLDRIGLSGVEELLGKGRMDESGDFTPGVGLDDDQIAPILQFVNAGANATSRQDVLAKLADLVGDHPDGSAGVAELALMDELFTGAGFDSASVSYDPTIVRGLDYYTGPVFEIQLTEISWGSIGGGGRYDDLVKRFTGQEVPATGASIGIDRLLAALNTLEAEAAAPLTGPVVVTVMDKERIADYQQMVTELRAAGITAELYLGNKGLGHQLKYADRRHSPVAVIAGSDEFDTDQLVIKDLAAGKRVSLEISDRQEWLEADVQRSIPRADLVSTILSQLGDK